VIRFLVLGRVRVVEPAGFTKVSSLGVEEQRVLVIIDFASPPEVWQGLGDAYRLDAIFVIWEANNVLQMPESALFRRGEGWAVFTIENKRAKLQEVKVGRRNGIAAEIISGVAEGAVVITHPDDAIQEGIKVRERPAAPGTSQGKRTLLALSTVPGIGALPQEQHPVFQQRDRPQRPRQKHAKAGADNEIDRQDIHRNRLRPLSSRTPAAALLCRASSFAAPPS
jgi:hypothetical protein